MPNPDDALRVARKSPRVARLLASTILAAARIDLQMSVSEADAEALAHDYLPTGALERIRENQKRRELRGLPNEYRDRGVLSRTILEGVVRTSADQLRVDYGGIWGLFRIWKNDLAIRIRSWYATKQVNIDLREKSARDERT